MNRMRGVVLAAALVVCGLSACTGSPISETVSPSTTPTTGTAKPNPIEPSAPQATTRTSQAPKPKAPSSRTQSAAGTKSADPQKSVAGLPTCALADLPSATADIVAKIKTGGPFQYPKKDGSTFGNFEGLLPKKSRGYYREHTVRTPRVQHRGARRIVTGGKTATAPDWWYYTGDHYKSFCVMTGV